MNLNYQMVLILCQIIQDYNEYIIEEHETLTTIPLIPLYINRINNRLLFQI